MIQVKYPYDYLPMVKHYLKDRNIDTKISVSTLSRPEIVFGFDKDENAFIMTLDGAPTVEKTVKSYYDTTNKFLGNISDKLANFVEVSFVEEKAKPAPTSKRKPAASSAKSTTSKAKTAK